MDGCNDGCVSAHGAIDAWRDGWMCACMDALMEVFVYSVDSQGGYVWMGEWLGEWRDAWSGAWEDASRDRRMHGWIAAWEGA